MACDLSTYRIRIGCFNARVHVKVLFKCTRQFSRFLGRGNLWINIGIVLIWGATISCNFTLGSRRTENCIHLHNCLFMFSLLSALSNLEPFMSHIFSRLCTAYKCCSVIIIRKFAAVSFNANYCDTTSQTFDTSYDNVISLLLLMSGDVHPNPGPLSLSICHTNIRGLVIKTADDPMYKADEIYSSLCIDKLNDFICITESHLDHTIDSADLPFPADGYVLYRRDRQSRGGGVCILASTRLPHSRIDNLTHPGLENIWVEIVIGKRKVMLGVLYRRPNQSVHDCESFIDNLQENLSQVVARKPDSIFLLGDLNDRCTTWNSDHAHSELKNNLLNLVLNNDLTQIIDEPTRITSHSATLLDLIITDSPGYVSNSGVCEPIADSDHCTTYCRTTFGYNVDKPYTRTFYDYNKANFTDLNTAIAQSPLQTLLYAVDDVNDATAIFYDIINDISKTHIPSNTVLVRPKDKPWMTGRVKKLLRIRNRKHKIFKRTKRESDGNIWKQSRNEAKIAINETKTKYYDNLYGKLQDPTTAPKQYWRIAKSLYGAKKSHCIPNIRDNDVFYNMSIDKCELFNSYFVGQTSLTIPDGHSLPPITNDTEDQLNEVRTIEEKVKQILLKLDINKASGPDHIPNKVLTYCCDQLAQIFCKIFQMSINDGVVPMLWKTAYITPVPKRKKRRYHLMTTALWH